MASYSGPTTQRSRVRTLTAWAFILGMLFGATILGGQRVFAAGAPWHFYTEEPILTRCAVVDPHANKVVETKQSSGDTIVKVIGYVDAGDHIEWESHVWRFARHLVTRQHGTGLRHACR